MVEYSHTDKHTIVKHDALLPLLVLTPKMAFWPLGAPRVPLQPEWDTNKMTKYSTEPIKKKFCTQS